MLINLDLTKNHSYNIYNNKHYNNIIPHYPNNNTINDNYTRIGKHSEPSFGIKIKTEAIPGELPKELQLKLTSIRKSIKNIKDFYAQYAVSNPALNARIKKGYRELIIKKKSAIIFKHINDTTVTVMQGQKNPEILYISVDKEGEAYNGIIADGNKLIKNYRPNNPHMLPSKLQYFNQEEITQSKVGDFIDLAFDKISQYHHYISKYKSGEVPLPKADSIHPTLIKDANQELAVIHRNSVAYGQKSTTTNKSKKTAQTTAKAAKGSVITQKVKDFSTNINEIFTADPKTLAPHINAKVASSGKTISFSVKTADGGQLRVSKVASINYGNTMLYLSIVKHNPDQTQNYISIDLANYSILKTKTEGKPFITFAKDEANNTIALVHEMTTDEIAHRKIIEKLDEYAKEIIKDTKSPVAEAELKPEQISAATKPEKEIDTIITTTKRRTRTPKKEKAAEIPAKEPIILKEISETKPLTEQIRDNLLADFKEKVTSLAKQDAIELAEEYKKVFVAEFTKAINNIKIEINKKAEEILASFANIQ